MINFDIKIPKWIMNIKYNSKIIPNWEKHDIIKFWSNCQVFAYEILRLIIELYLICVLKNYGIYDEKDFFWIKKIYNQTSSKISLKVQ